MALQDTLLYKFWVEGKTVLVDNYMLKVNNRHFRKRCGICSKLTIKTPERHQWRRSSVFTVKSEHIWAGNFEQVNAGLFGVLASCVIPASVNFCKMLELWKSFRSVHYEFLWFFVGFWDVFFTIKCLSDSLMNILYYNWSAFLSFDYDDIISYR